MVRERVAQVSREYRQSSISGRIEAFLIDHVGMVVNNDQIKQVARNPQSGLIPENWHQRLSELRTDKGYTILSQRDDPSLRNGEYCLATLDRRATAKGRKAVNASIKAQLLAISPICVFPGCGLSEGDRDPVGGGTVRLQVDHKTAHDHDDRGVDDMHNYQLLCGRHNVTKKNFWDDETGKLNIKAILQATPHREKLEARQWLNNYFDDSSDYTEN